MIDTESGTHSAAIPLNHSMGDVEQDVEYRSLSVLSVIGLVLGLASFVSLFAPLLLALPIFGIAIAVLAIRRIAASDGQMVGRGAAIVGLALCVASVAAVSSRAALARAILSRQASSVAREWFDSLTSGNIDQAFELTTEGVRQRESETSPDALRSHDQGAYSYREPSDAGEATSTPAESFANHPLVKALAKLGAEARVRFVRTLKYQPGSHGHYTVRQLYQVIPSDGPNGGGAFDVRVELERLELPGFGERRWMVAHFQSDAYPTGHDHGP